MLISLHTQCILSEGSQAGQRRQTQDHIRIMAVDHPLYNVPFGSERFREAKGAGLKIRSRRSSQVRILPLAFIQAENHQIDKFNANLKN